MATNESQLVGQIQRSIAQHYPSSWCFKVVGSPYQMTGVPDLLVVVEGALVGIEVKFPRPGESAEHILGRVTPIQWAQINKINRAGGTAGVATSVDQAHTLITRALEKKKR